jgi:hypothetical protein
MVALLGLGCQNQSHIPAPGARPVTISSATLGRLTSSGTGARRTYVSCQPAPGALGEGRPDAWISRDLYGRLDHLVGRKTRAEFAHPLGRGFAGAEGEAGIKPLKYRNTAEFAHIDKKYQYELRIPSSTYRLLGYYDAESKHYVFDRLWKSH